MFERDNLSDYEAATDRRRNDTEHVAAGQRQPGTILLAPIKARVINLDINKSCLLSLMLAPQSVSLQYLPNSSR